MTTTQTPIVDERVKEWDHHGSYQWTYFPESAKKLIQFFLSGRISGRNLDVGSGWYLYHPNSTALDLSPKCLEYNPSKEKMVFDLERIAEGQPLPFPDNSFSSASLVSVWQYLNSRKLLLKELERVLVPGGEVFIINQKGSGLVSQLRASGDPKTIEEEVMSEGYDCIREVIPFGPRGYLFESVSVAMPDIDLFGHAPSRVANREARIEESNDRKERPGQFYKDFALWETRRAALAFSQLGKYPVTAYSQEFLANLQRASDHIERLTGKTVVFYEPDPMVGTHLRIPNSDDMGVRLGTLENGESGKISAIERDSDIIRSYGIRGIMHQIGFLSFNKVEELESFLKGEEKLDLRDYRNNSIIGFLASTPLNGQARLLQERLRKRLSKVRGLESKIEKVRRDGVCNLMDERKQRRRVDFLIKRKREIESGKIEIVGHGRVDYMPSLKQFYDDLLDGVKGASSRWCMDCGDD